MSSDTEPHPEALELLGDIEVIQDRRIHRIMIYENAPALIFKRAEPLHSLLRHKSRSHTHIRAAVAAYKTPSLLGERKVLIAKDFQESIAAAFRPVCIMIALHNKIWDTKRIHHTLGYTDFLICSEIRDIASEKHEVQRVRLVNISQARTEVLYRTGMCRKMSVSDKCESEDTVPVRKSRCPRNAGKRSHGHQ